MPGRKKTTTSVKEGDEGNVNANFVDWPFGCPSTATMSVRHGLPGMMTENMTMELGRLLVTGWTNVYEMSRRIPRRRTICYKNCPSSVCIFNRFGLVCAKAATGNFLNGWNLKEKATVTKCSALIDKGYLSISGIVLIGVVTCGIFSMLSVVQPSQTSAEPPSFHISCTWHWQIIDIMEKTYLDLVADCDR